MMYDIFNKLLERKNVTAYRVAKETGISTATLSDWKKGRSTPKQDKLQKIADYFGVSIDYLMTGEELTQNKIRDMTKIPVLGVVKAGLPMTAVENILDWEEIPYEMARAGEFFALNIKGDSMEPKLSEGDVVIIKKQSDVESGDVAVVLVNGDEATIKKVKKHDGGGISLIAMNPAYSPLFFTDAEIESLPVTILGRAIEYRGKL